jgi:hypothetical protein
MPPPSPMPRNRPRNHHNLQREVAPFRATSSHFGPSPASLPDSLSVRFGVHPRPAANLQTAAVVGRCHPRVPRQPPAATSPLTRGSVTARLTQRPSLRDPGGAPSDRIYVVPPEPRRRKKRHESGPLALAHDVPLAVVPFAALLQCRHREGCCPRTDTAVGPYRRPRSYRSLR